MKVNIKQALVKSRIYIWGGRFLIAAGFLFYIISTLLFVYHGAQELTQSPLFWKLGVAAQNAIASIYEATSPFIGVVWRYAPTVDRYNVFSYGNLWFVGLLGVMALGGQLVKTGMALRRRINKQIERFEDSQWKASMNDKFAQSVSFKGNNIGTVNVYGLAMPDGSDRSFWKEPLGAAAISILTAYLAAVLAKLTGMV